ncbi:MAG: hypothetical protein ACFFCW_12960 [Candidatus Hodarchaeota archaeon]
MKIMKILLISLTTNFLLFSSSIGAMRAWVDHGSVKVRQMGDPIGDRTDLSIECAKNEFESFQIFIFADGENLENVDVTVNDFSDGKGHTINDIYIYKEYYLNITTVSRSEYEPGYWPDALLPKVDRYYRETRNTFPFSIADGHVQGVWVDIGTTADTPAGIYTGTYVVSSDGASDLTGIITLTVWNFTLPSTPSMPTLFTIETAALANGHDRRFEWNDSWLASMKKVYLKAYLYHRIGCSSADGGVVWTPCNSSGVVTSWTHWMTAFKDALDGTAISSGPYARATMVSDIHAQRVADTSENRYRTYLQQWWDKWKAEGWDPMKNLFLWTYDEPHGETVSYRGKSVTDYQKILIKAGDMNTVDTGGEGMWKNSFTTEERKPELSDPAGGYKSLDVSGFYCPVAQHYEYRPPWQDPSYKVPRNSYPGYSSWAENNHWTYISNMNHGTEGTGGDFYNGQIDIMVDTPAFYIRAISWVLWKYKVTGFLYYMTNLCFYDAPYNSLWKCGGNGDGTLFYPGVPSKTGRSLPASTPAIGGSHDIPIESIRLKLVREAMEDREYMEVLRKLGDENYANMQVDTIFTSLKEPPGPYYQLNTDADNLLGARRNMALKILELIGQDTDPPAAPTGLTIIR